MAFVSRQLVRFADIDRAGIVYYPRFFDFWHRALEDLFYEDLQLPYHQVVDGRRVGFPVVHVESDFRVPLQHGDRMAIELTTLRLGGKSFTIRYRTFRPGDEAVAAEGTIVHACVDMETLRGIAIPDDIRAGLARHLVEDAARLSIESLDHLVLTVRDVEATRRFYVDVLGMRLVEFQPGRLALHFGRQKLNLHEAARPIDPLVRHATPGSADVCFLSRTPMPEIVAALRAAGLTILAGPARRAGAQGPIESVYVYDPDENLVEIANRVAQNRT